MNMSVLLLLAYYSDYLIPPVYHVLPVTGTLYMPNIEQRRGGKEAQGIANRN